METPNILLLNKVCNDIYGKAKHAKLSKEIIVEVVTNFPDHTYPEDVALSIAQNFLDMYFTEEHTKIAYDPKNIARMIFSVRYIGKDEIIFG